MVLVLFKNLKEQDKTHAVQKLIHGSTPSQDFFFMIILAMLTATFGLLLNNIPVIIGSMLISPILYPILSIALGITISDNKIISRAIFTVLKSLTLGVLSSAIATFLFIDFAQNEVIPDLLAIKPSLVNLLIAIIAGFAASFALAKEQLSDTLPGTAISVTLIPPVAATGIGLALLSPEIVKNAILMFSVNCLGIIFAGTITFSLMNFYSKRNKAEEEVKKEDKKVKDENNKAKKPVL